MPEDEPIHTFMVGTAGSGKSQLTWAYKRWMNERGLDAITVNLDPGVEHLPYTPDVDIRDWIKLSDVMDEYGLGPNGAQVVAADLLALRAPDVQEAIQSFRPDLVLLDTPGQTELFVFRDAGHLVVEFLGEGRSLIAFLVDPFLAKSASAFVSQLMLSATTQFRFQVPMVNVLTKMDLMKEETLERITGWAEDLDTLYDDLMEEAASPYNQLNTDLFKVMEGMGTYSAITPTSGETLEGLEDLYAHTVSVFRGAEDIMSD